MKLLDILFITMKNFIPLFNNVNKSYVLQRKFQNRKYCNISLNETI